MYFINDLNTKWSKNIEIMQYIIFEGVTISIDEATKLIRFILLSVQLLSKSVVPVVVSFPQPIYISFFIIVLFIVYLSQYQNFDLQYMLVLYRQV